MKTSIYQRLRKRLTILFLLQTIILTLALLIMIGILNYQSNYLASIGGLQTTDFLMFYRQHSWELNTFLFAGGFGVMMFVFIRSFFKSMRILLLEMQGEEISRYPFLYRLLPEFQETNEKIKEMIDKRNTSRELSQQEKEHKNELLMYLAHDLKTPLTSMIGYINHILDHPLKKEEEESAIIIANQKAKRLDDLIDEFSEMLRYDDKVNQLEITRIDLSTMLVQQLAGFYPLVEKKDITLQETIQSNIYIQGDFDKLLRVFDNLMRNAINYSLEHTKIRILMKLANQEVIITYQNVGEEIDEETISHLFDKFYRASTARTTTNGGAGLGLAIAKEIVHLHHGEINAKAKDNVITFEIHLPYLQEAK